MVYYDTNVWVSYMLGDKDAYYAHCKPLVENVENRKKIAVVSYLVIIEVIHVLRQRITEKSKFVGDGRIERDGIIARANALVVEFISIIDTLSKEQKIIIARSGQKIHEHHHTVMKKMVGYFGHVRTVSMCPNCKKRWAGRESQINCPSCKSGHRLLSKYQYKALGHADMEQGLFPNSLHAASTGIPRFAAHLSLFSTSRFHPIALHKPNLRRVDAFLNLHISLWFSASSAPKIPSIVARIL